MSIPHVTSSSTGSLKAEASSSQPSTATPTISDLVIDLKVKKEMRLLEAIWNAHDDQRDYSMILGKGIKDVGRKVDALVNASAQGHPKLERSLEKIRISNLNDQEFQTELLWATHPALISHNTKIDKALGLSQANQRLMLQYGATD